LGKILVVRCPFVRLTAQQRLLAPQATLVTTLRAYPIHGAEPANVNVPAFPLVGRTVSGAAGPGRFHPGILVLVIPAPFAGALECPCALPAAGAGIPCHFGGWSSITHRPRLLGIRLSLH